MLRVTSRCVSAHPDLARTRSCSRPRSRHRCSRCRTAPCSTVRRLARGPGLVAVATSVQGKVTESARPCERNGIRCLLRLGFRVAQNGQIDSEGGQRQHAMKSDTAIMTTMLPRSLPKTRRTVRIRDSSDRLSPRLLRWGGRTRLQRILARARRTLQGPFTLPRAGRRRRAGLAGRHLGRRIGGRDQRRAHQHEQLRPAVPVSPRLEELTEDGNVAEESGFW